MSKIARNLLRGIEVLRFPIVLVTADRNIMTAGAFSFYSAKPPCVMVGIKPENYTFELIMQNREFGINIPTKQQFNIVRFCGSVSGRNVDKFSVTRVTPQKNKVIKSLLIKECPVNLECKVVHQISYKGSHRWFVGQIVAVHIKQNFLKKQALSLDEYRNLDNNIPKIENKRR